MHKKLSHLSQDDLQELLRRYYDPEKEFTVSQIMTDFAVDARPGELVSLLPESIHEEACPHCEGVKLRSKAQSRSSYGQSTPTCPNCGHELSRYCACTNCRYVEAEEKDAQERVQRAAVFQHYGPDAWPTVSPGNELALEDAIYLKAIVTHRVAEDLSEVEPTVFTRTRLAPGELMVWDVLKHLYHYTKAIAPSPESDLSAFEFKIDGTESPSFFMNKVRWLLLPSLSSSARTAYLREVDAKLRALADSEDMEFSERALWHEIVKHEAIEYYKHKLAEVNVELDQIGNKTHAVFDDLVNRFSLANIYQIIYAAVRSTLHYTTQQSIPRYQAKNMYIGSIEGNANKFEAEGWLKNYRRDFNCPQSTLSAIFFDFYLGIGASYFETVLPTLPSSDLS